MIRFLVDADSCAREARLILEKKSISLGIPLLFYANRNIPFSLESSLFEMKICPDGADSADDLIVSECRSEDIVVTRDLLLAKRLVDKNIHALNDKGTLFEKKNIDDLIEERNYSLMMKSLGVATGGKMRNYGSKDSRNFLEAIESLL